MNEIPKRFLVSRSTLWMDKIMTGVIISGGVVIIIAVLGIFFFILKEALPLFGSADIDKESSTPSPVAASSAIALNDDAESIRVYDGGSTITSFNRDAKSLDSKTITLPADSTATAWSYSPENNALIVGTDNANVGKVDYSEHSDLATVFYPLGETGNLQEKVVSLDYGDSGDTKLYGAITQDQQGKRLVRFLLLEKKGGLMGSKKGAEPTAWLEGKLEGVPEKILVTNSANGAIVYTNDNKLHYFEINEDAANLVQTIDNPLNDGQKVSDIAWVFGDVSLIVGGEQGGLKTYGLYRQQIDGKGTMKRRFGITKEYKPMDGAVTGLVASLKNKSFFAASNKEIRLIFNTAADIRQQILLDYTPVSLAVDKSFTHLTVSDDKHNLHFYRIDDPFPEAGLKALFSKIWYEGYEKPDYIWQSSAANDDAEPKMSLTTLIFGTLKGTLYALIFAIPIALMAAIYTSQFMPPGVKRIIKPIMEIMASLPSVVLGFFGALYLAPKMEDKVPALIAMAILIPATAILLGYLWSGVRIEIRNRFKSGLEYMVMIPLVALIGWLCWSYLGGYAEQLLIEGTRWAFSTLDFMGFSYDANFQADNFRELWQNGFSLDYEQRNSLVVGFIMGFAVIPVIFTIAEDSLSNVPVSLIAAAEALGASRWQIVRTVVLPIAAAGIFSSLMIGLGRAVGETMIVLMATGNTPIMEWNIFNGMRTLAANIATELPEAVEHSGHYRVLFLSALILFAMTFVLNTVAELLRHKLRERFKVV